MAQTRQLRLQGVAAQQQRFEEAQAAAAAARAARTAKNRRGKERKKEKARLRREQQSEPTSMADEDEISDEQQLSMAAATVDASVNARKSQRRGNVVAPQRPLPRLQKLILRAACSWYLLLWARTERNGAAAPLL